MGLQQIILVVSIRHHVKAEQMREMPTRRSSPPPKIMASLKSQDLAQKVSATTIQPMRKLQREKHCDGLKPSLRWHRVLQLYQEKHFLPISPSLIHPQHLSSQRKGQRQVSQHDAKQLAEMAADVCCILAVMKTGQMRKMFSLAALTWNIISSQLPLYKVTWQRGKKRSPAANRLQRQTHTIKFVMIHHLVWLLNSQCYDFLCSDTQLSSIYTLPIF